MKTKLSILTLGLLMICLVGTAKETESTLLSGQSQTELGQYTIHKSAKALTLGNETLKTYELDYSNSNSPILIGVEKAKKCMNFIIRTTNFEVEYSFKNHIFGVKRISKQYQTIGNEVINKMLDNAQFCCQRIISKKTDTEEELLGLIACYFPSLIKSEYLAQM